MGQFFYKFSNVDFILEIESRNFVGLGHALLHALLEGRHLDNVLLAMRRAEC